jgi:hypothetical protein
MPRLVDYSSRFEFLREAAFEVVLTRGVDALSRQAVASVQGVSPSTVRRLVAADSDLLVLAAGEVVARRRRGRWHAAARGTPSQRALDLLRTLIPDSDDRIAEELVWWRIVFSTRVGSGSDRVPASPDGSLRQRYQIALQGYADATTHDTDGDGPEISAELTRLIDARTTEIAAVLATVLDLLDVPDFTREQHLEDLRVLIDGIRVAVCTGRISPAEAVQALERAAVTAA